MDRRKFLKLAGMGIVSGAVIAGLPKGRRAAIEEQVERQQSHDRLEGLGLQSPSKVFQQYGTDMVEELELGIRRGSSMVLDNLGVIVNVSGLGILSDSFEERALALQNEVMEILGKEANRWRT